MIFTLTEEQKKTEKIKEDSIKRIEQILSENNIKMSIWSCGCCDSPYVKFEYNGEIIIDEGFMNIDMFE